MRTARSYVIGLGLFGAVSLATSCANNTTQLVLDQMKRPIQERIYKKMIGDGRERLEIIYSNGTKLTFYDGERGKINNKPDMFHFDEKGKALEYMGSEDEINSNFGDFYRREKNKAGTPKLVGPFNLEQSKRFFEQFEKILERKRNTI